MSSTENCVQLTDSLCMAYEQALHGNRRHELCNVPRGIQCFLHAFYDSTICFVFLS